jgi:hypothetical protein
MASGQVQLENIAALRANLAAGAVVIGHTAATVDIEGGTASVRIGDIAGVAKYHGTTGKVRIGHALSDIELDGSSGSFDIDRAEGNVIATTANCPIRIGRLTRGQTELTNASGGHRDRHQPRHPSPGWTPTAPRAPSATPCRHTQTPTTPTTPTTKLRSTPAPGSATSSSTARPSESPPTRNGAHAHLATTRASRLSRIGDRAHGWRCSRRIRDADTGDRHLRRAHATRLLLPGRHPRARPGAVAGRQRRRRRRQKDLIRVDIIRPRETNSGCRDWRRSCRSRDTPAGTRTCAPTTPSPGSRAGRRGSPSGSPPIRRNARW